MLMQFCTVSQATEEVVGQKDTCFAVFGAAGLNNICFDLIQHKRPFYSHLLLQVLSRPGIPISLANNLTRLFLNF